VNDHRTYRNPHESLHVCADALAALAGRKQSATRDRLDEVLGRLLTARAPELDNSTHVGSMPTTVARSLTRSGFFHFQSGGKAETLCFLVLQPVQEKGRRWMLDCGSNLRAISLASTTTFREHFRHSTSSESPWRMIERKLSSIGCTITNSCGSIRFRFL